MQTKKYTEYGLGFERTQLFKEHESPMIRRQSALNAAQAFYGNNDIQYSATELKALYNRFLNLIENGDDSFFDKLDKHLQTKKNIESINV
jgi:hypothetical protein